MESQGNLDANGKIPLLSDYSKGELCGSSQKPLSWLDKASLHGMSAGELPISQECSFTQTIFNGMIVVGVFDETNIIMYLCNSLSFAIVNKLS